MRYLLAFCLSLAACGEVGATMQAGMMPPTPTITRVCYDRWNVINPSNGPNSFWVYWNADTYGHIVEMAVDSIPMAPVDYGDMAIPPDLFAPSFAQVNYSPTDTWITQMPLPTYTNVNSFFVFRIVAVATDGTWSLPSLMVHASTADVCGLPPDMGM